MYWGFLSDFTRMGEDVKGLLSLGWSYGRLRKSSSLNGVVFKNLIGCRGDGSGVGQQGGRFCQYRGYAGGVFLTSFPGLVVRGWEVFCAYERGQATGFRTDWIPRAAPQHVRIISIAISRNNSIGKMNTCIVFLKKRLWLGGGYCRWVTWFGVLVAVQKATILRVCLRGGDPAADGLRATSGGAPEKLTSMPTAHRSRTSSRGMYECSIGMSRPRGHGTRLLTGAPLKD